MKKVLVLINKISDHPSKDELDVLVQAEAVEKSLHELGYSYHRVFFDLDLKSMDGILKKSPPDLIFNLVETVAGKGELIHLPPSLLESYKIPFSGSGSFALLVTTNKLRTKEILKKNGVNTPEWLPQVNHNKPDGRKKYILKPVWEDGSSGITDDSIMTGNKIDIQHFRKNKKWNNYFVEEYIHGREFNMSILAGKDGPEVMPAAEMQYIDYPADKPRILNFASKWEENTFEYNHTIRSFDTVKNDSVLVKEMRKITRYCWDLFELKGYARIDFRIDERNRPFVLEVNANPCLSPDAGFAVACDRAGIDYTEIVKRIIYDATL